MCTMDYHYNTHTASPHPPSTITSLMKLVPAGRCESLAFGTISATYSRTVGCVELAGSSITSSNEGVWCGVGWCSSNAHTVRVHHSSLLGLGAIQGQYTQACRYMCSSAQGSKQHQVEEGLEELQICVGCVQARVRQGLCPLTVGCRRSLRL
jgi:hypothetical protein